MPPGMDWATAFLKPILLATRLINSPQAYQQDYCFYFGKSEKASLDPESEYDLSINGRTDKPVKYACDKAVGELTQSDINAVDKQRCLLANRIRIEIAELDSNATAECAVESPRKGFNGCDSTIYISEKLYHAAINKKRKPEETARIDLLVAFTLIHEILGHAAHNHLFGERGEDFCERSLITENGYVVESGITGVVFHVDLDKPTETFWHTWQHFNHQFDHNMLTRCDWKLPTNGTTFEADDTFVLKLFDDQFWTGEYLERGPVTLVPDAVAEVCRVGVNGGYRGNGYRWIPLNIRDLFRTADRSYAKRLFAWSANPGRELRSSNVEVKEHFLRR